MARKSKSKDQSKRASEKGKVSLAEVTAPKAKVDSAVYEKDPLKLESFMGETNGGGSPENVPGFNLFRAVTAVAKKYSVSGIGFTSYDPGEKVSSIVNGIIDIVIRG